MGVRLDGSTVTEAITGPNAGTVSGVQVFKSISAVNTTGIGPTEGLTIGIGRRFGLWGNRIRGIRVNLATDSGTLNLYNGGSASTGELIGKFVYPLVASGQPSVVVEDVPVEGIRTENKIYGSFTSGIKSVRITYA